ncbi:MAG: alkaline phosphatase family protein [Thermoleophilia bacterium]
MSKVTIIGLDGGTFTVIDYLSTLGRLPNLSKLMQRGGRATLLSTAPPVTWPAWSAFHTGTNPGKNGAADLFRFRPGSYQLEPMNGGNLRGASIWSLAGSRDKRVCIYNLPVTYPAAKVNGILISGLDAPSFNDQAIYPLEEKEKLLAAVPDFKINFDNEAKYLVNHHQNPVQEWIRQAKTYLDMEIRTINYLIQREDWDLFAAVIRSTDIFQHTLWLDAEKVMSGEEVSDDVRVRAAALFECYETIDRQFGEDAWASQGNLVIMSDHGFGELRGHVCINRVLAEAGLLSFRSSEAKTGPRKYLTQKLGAHLTANTKHNIKKYLGKAISDGRWRTYVDVLVADIDWSRTKICAIGGFGCLFLNLEGRNPMGTVSAEEQEEVLRQAESALSKLKDPMDGEPLVTRFYRKEELFSGPLTPEMPDLVVNMRDWSYCPVIGTARELASDKIIIPPIEEWKQLAHSGTHRREGILILHGPQIAAADLGEVEMVDIAPTVMNILGLPASAEWDGRILEAALSGVEVSKDESRGYDEQIADARDTAYSEEDEEEVRKRLEDLGYL